MRLRTLALLLAALPGLGVCAAEGVDGENGPQRGQFLPGSQAHSPAMGQEDGEKWTAAAHLQPTSLLSRRLLAQATGLVDAWRAAVQYDREHAVARAAHAAAQPRRDQAAALWRPGVALTAAAGWGQGESDVRGAHFSAPGMGASNDVGFGTSVTGGTATRWALQASQPLYNPQRRSQQQQLNLGADMADAAWQAAQQGLVLRTAERYLALALAQEALQLLDQQVAAVQQAATEAADRFALGDAPITDTHEARARLAALQAQRVAAHTALQVAQRALADSTGLPAITAQLPGVVAMAERPLADWQSAADADNPAIRQQTLAVALARANAERHRRSASATLDLIAQAGQERLHGSGDYGSARTKGTQALVGVQLTVPLSTGGLRAAQEDEALRLAEQALAQAEATRNDVARQVHAAWLGLSAGSQRVQALAEALRASEARQGATRLAHSVGDRTLLDRLNAENDAAAARLALVQARAGLLLDHLRLAALAGRLDEAALTGRVDEAAGQGAPRNF